MRRLQRPLLFRSSYAIFGPGYRYWRLNVTANNGSTDFLGIAELKMSATVGGADMLAPNKTQLSFSSIQGGSTASNQTVITDGDFSTQWLTLFGQTTGFVAMDFLQPTNVAQVSITFVNSGTISSAPRDFSVDHSDDGVTYTPAHSYTGQTVWGLGETRVFTV